MRYILPLFAILYLPKTLPTEQYTSDEKHSKPYNCTGKLKNKIETLLENLSDNEKIECTDINFDGQPEIIIRHPPSGQTQMSSVFIFNEKSKSFIKNEEISNIPCLEIDEKNKRISGTCFSSSNCDTWSEEYKFNKEEKLEITAMKGTYCDPSTGDTYSYFEKYNDGKISKRKVAPIVKKD
ncbi:XAC2610-related protein [Pseudomonas citronellolis]|uniref:XAC2610-related protein n=1 Tax=Pseudomonas citronellolis TaxID=53408 RepID=UPI00209ED3D0|nr:hypothetical protein [Pseudomonas citronellolis]MCP1603816.1 hypothetical protein [Pseudomonas citronellolis]MCP1654534.1 hypothetical protein [Pseudomonas citronellolis]MCP1721474.1 hypothetical protein [Pseudomonas citronellolis]